jgi:5-methylcytosine-specific restriction endonuclease McrA/transcriptional regulator
MGRWAPLEERAIRDKRILELREQGWTIKKITAEIGCGHTTVGNVIYDGEKIARRREEERRKKDARELRDKRIFELNEQGWTQAKIAIELGCSAGIVTLILTPKGTPCPPCGVDGCPNTVRTLRGNATTCIEHAHFCTRCLTRPVSPNHGSRCLECDAEEHRIKRLEIARVCRVEECSALATGQGANVFCPEHKTRCIRCLTETRTSYDKYCRSCHHVFAHRYRAQKRGVPHHNIDKQFLLAIHPFCGLCGGDFEPDEKIHIDHVIPQIKGGWDTYANLQPAHARCNLSKNDRYDPDSPQVRNIKFKGLTNFERDHLAEELEKIQRYDERLYGNLSG